MMEVKMLNITSFFRSQLPSILVAAGHGGKG